MKKRWIAWMLCAVSAFSLTACAGGEDGSAASGEAAEGTELSEDGTDDGVIDLTVWSEKASIGVVTQMVESFEAEHAGEAQFQIQVVEAADAETKNHLLGDVHHGADIFPLADDQLQSMVAGGALAPVPNADEIAAANLEEAVEAATVNDVLYAYPMSADNGYFLYYNKEYFTDEDVKTLDRILEVCAENEKKFTMEWDSGWYLYSFFGNTGLEFGINEDGVTNHCNWNAADGPITGVDIAEAMLAIAENPGFENRTDTEFMEGVKDGSVIAGVSGVWNVTEIKEAWGDYGAVKLPTYTVAGQQVQMASFVGYKMLGVNAYSEHVDWALALADWMTNEENQKLRFAERSQGPSNRNAAASDEVGQVPAIAAVLEQSQYGVLQRVGNSYWTPLMEFGLDMAAGHPSGTGLQETMDALVAGITASVAQ